MTELMTDDLLYLSSSGNVAGRSLKMTTGSFALISASYYLCRSIDQLLTPDGLLHHSQSPQLQNVSFRPRVGVRGDDEYRYGSVPAPELDEEIDSRFTRHAIVADDEVVVLESERLQRPVHALCRLDRMALSFEYLPNRVPAGLIVVCD